MGEEEEDEEEEDEEEEDEEAWLTERQARLRRQIQELQELEQSVTQRLDELHAAKSEVRWCLVSFLNLSRSSHPPGCVQKLVVYRTSRALFNLAHCSFKRSPHSPLKPIEK